MPSWGQRQHKPSLGTPAGDAVPGTPQKAGFGIAIAFGAMALVSVAVCCALLLVQRNEQRKLEMRVAERDERLREMEARVDASARDAETARRERRNAQDALEGFRRGAEATAQSMQQELADLQEEKEGLQDELDQAKTAEERLNEEAKKALQRSSVNQLPVRKPEDPCIDAKTTFRPTITMIAAGPAPADLARAAAKAAESSLLNAKVPLAPTGFRAYVDGRIHIRTSLLSGRAVTAMSIEVSLMLPSITTSLDKLAWEPALSEMDVMIVEDDKTMQGLAESRTKALADQLLQRAAKGGPAGELANRPLN